MSLLVTLVSYVLYIQTTLLRWFRMVVPATAVDLFLLVETGQKVSVEVSSTAYNLVIKEPSGSKGHGGQLEAQAPHETSELLPDSPSVSRANLPRFLVNHTVFVLDSLNSGTGRSEKRNLYTKVLKPVLDLLGVEHQHVPTTSVDVIGEFSGSLGSKNTSGKPITVIFISGDTSISEFVNGLESVESGSITVFPIPGGTGNSLALSLGFLDEIKSIQRLLKSLEKPAPLNLYEAEFPKGSYYLVQNERTGEINKPLKFLVVVSWGFHASLVADSDTPELRKNGLDRFKVAAFANLERDQKYEGTFSINSRKFDGPFAYWLLTPSKKFEPTFEISPDGNIFDDNLYLVSFKNEEDTSGKYILDIMGEAYNKGSHVKNEKVTYEKISKSDKLVLNVRNAKDLSKRRFCLDGSIIALPEVDDHQITVKTSGNTQNGWELFIVR